MAFNINLFHLSRQVLEPYVIDIISKRPNVDHVELSTVKEDQQQKIDCKVFTKDGKVVPIQVKTRQKDYPNFAIPFKDIIEDQEERVFCFIDKTFDDVTICKLLDLNEMAKVAIADEAPKVFMLTQKQFLIDKDKFDVKNSKGDSYYLVSKTYLNTLKYNQ